MKRAKEREFKGSDAARAMFSLPSIDKPVTAHQRQPVAFVPEVDRPRFKLPYLRSSSPSLPKASSTRKGPLELVSERFVDAKSDLAPKRRQKTRKIETLADLKRSVLDYEHLEALRRRKETLWRREESLACTWPSLGIEQRIEKDPPVRPASLIKFALLPPLERKEPVERSFSPLQIKPKVATTQQPRLAAIGRRQTARVRLVPITVPQPDWIDFAYPGIGGRAKERALAAPPPSPSPAHSRSPKVAPAEERYLKINADFPPILTTIAGGHLVGSIQVKETARHSSLSPSEANPGGGEHEDTPFSGIAPPDNSVVSGLGAGEVLLSDHHVNHVSYQRGVAPLRQKLFRHEMMSRERDDHLDKSTTYLSAGYAALDEEKSDYGSGIEDNHSLAFVTFEMDEGGKLGLKPVSKIPLESRHIAQRIARKMQKKISKESDKREVGEDFYEIPPGSAVLMGRDGEDPMMLLPDGQIISIPPHFLEDDEEEEECATGAGEGKTIEPIHSFDGIAGSTCSDSGVFESNQSHVLSTVRKSLLPVIPHSPRQASQREIDVADSASVEKEYNVTTDSVAAEGGVKVNREERFVEKEQRRELLRDLNGRLDDVHLHENDRLSRNHHLENDRPDHLHDDSGSDGGLSGNSGNGSINGLSEEEKLALWRREYREKQMQQMEVAWEQYKELKKREEEEEKRKEEIRKEKTKKINKMMEQTGNTESEAAIASSTSESISERNDNKTTKLKSVEASSPSTDVFELTIADRSPVGIGSSAESATASESSDASGCASDDDAAEETTGWSSAHASAEDAPKKMTAAKKKIKSLSKTKKRTEKGSSKTKKDDTGKTDEKKAKKKKKKAREDTKQSTTDSTQDVEESGDDSEADDAKLKLNEKAEKSGTTVHRKVKASEKLPGAEENRISSVGSKREMRRNVGVDRATIGATNVEEVEKESDDNSKTKQREADRRKRLEKWAEIAERRRREVATKRQEEKERKEAERLAAAEEELRMERMKREEEQRLQDHIARRRQKMLEERESRERAEREADERREAEKRKQEMLRRQMEEMRLKLESEIIRRREEEARRLELARIEAEEEAEQRLQEEAERLEWERRIAEETDETKRAELEAMRREAEEAARRREQERRQRSAEERDRIRRLEEEKQRELDKQSWYTEMASEALRTMRDLKINRAFTYSYFALGQTPDFYAQDL